MLLLLLAKMEKNYQRGFMLTLTIIQASFYSDKLLLCIGEKRNLTPSRIDEE